MYYFIFFFFFFFFFSSRRRHTRLCQVTGVQTCALPIFFTGSLRTAAVAALAEAGAVETHVQVFEVPGAFEVPQAARAAAESGRFDAVVCLGCVVRGETPHFDYISSAVAHGIMT